MEFATINISQLNDFIFCPYSIYLHNIYAALDEEQFTDTPQRLGKYAHHSVDSGSYDTKKNHITGMMVYSQQFGLIGKIDQYFIESKKLVERKRKITTIYEGYKLQLYAQYFCLKEMGFLVERLTFHSMMDNKNYDIPVPDAPLEQWFADTLARIRSYQPSDAVAVNEKKCRYCIYAALCDKTTIDG